MRMTLTLSEFAHVRPILRKGWFVGVTFTHRRSWLLWVRVDLQGPEQGLEAVAAAVDKTLEQRWLDRAAW